jgi:hypothetical protein
MTEVALPSISEAEAAVEKFLSHFDELRKIPEAFAHAINTALDIIPIEWIQHKIIQAWEHLKDLLAKLLDILKKVGEFALFPAKLIARAIEWNDLAAAASNVVGNIDPATYTALQGTQQHNWQGQAANDYKSCASAQAASTSQLKDVAGSVTGALAAAGVSGTVLYAALGALIGETAAELAAEAAGAATGVGTLPSIGAAIMSAIKSAAIATALIYGAGEVFKAQAGMFVTLELQSQDNSKFPHGNWPDPGAQAY